MHRTWHDLSITLCIKNRDNIPVFAIYREILGKGKVTSAVHRHYTDKIDKPLISKSGIFLRDLSEVGGLGAALIVIFVVAYLIAQGS